MRHGLTAFIQLSFLFTLAACGGGATPVDSGSPGEGGADAGADLSTGLCVTDHDCADDFFCNGIERCRIGMPGANSHGCLPGTSPCAAAQTCNEATAHCDSMCAVAMDADGDGHNATACGGDDCDDGDASRYPGNSEVCDATSHDEDCDTSTFGMEDNDGDGHVSAMCCNTDAATVLHCGDDCDDTNMDVHPGVPEVCNMLDDNCNGMVDEMVIAMVYLDADGDGFGDPTHSVAGCMAGVIGGMTYVTNSTDCDDVNAMIHPGGTELCDNIDTDCDPTTFGMGEDDDGDHFVDVMCGGNDCQDTLLAVHPGASEICDGWDTDCGSSGDAIPAEDMDGDMHASPSAPCGGAGGFPKDDCDDSNASVVPGTPRCAPVPPGPANSVQVCGMDGAWGAPTACVAPMPFCDPGTAACTAGICGNGVVESPEACDDHNTANLDGCDDHCRVEPAAIRQIEPYSGGYSASTTPFFRVVWSGTFPLGGTFQVQRSTTRAFTSPVAVPLGAVTTMFFEQTATASAALPVGRTWVRVRAIGSNGAASVWSPPWLVSIGHARNDLTGDGNADWVAGERQYQSAGSFVGRVRVFGTNSGAGSSIIGSAGAHIGDHESHGDFNGDGIEDLLIGNQDSGLGGGTVDVYFGGGGGTTMNTTLDQQYFPPAAVRSTTALNFGTRAASVGDVNGDGIDDIVSATTQYSPDSVENPAYLAFGSTGASLTGPNALALHHVDTNVSVWAIAGGDVNGDGLSDILLTGNQTAASGTHDVDRGVLSIIYGNTMVPFDTTVDVTIQGSSAASTNRMGQDVAAADLDRDGYADMIAGATYVDVRLSPMAPPSPGMSATYVFKGGASLGAGIAPAVTVSGVTGAFGFSVDAGADLNLDGYLDVVIGAPLFQGGGLATSGRAYVFTGGNPLSWPLPAFTYDGTQVGGNAGLCVQMIGRSTLGGVSQTLIGVGAPYMDYTFSLVCRIPPCGTMTYTTAGRFYVVRADGATHTVQHSPVGGNTAASCGWSTAN